MWLDETLVALEVVYHLCLDLMYCLWIYIWIFSFGYCYDTVCLYFTCFVHVAYLYVDTRCYDDIHEVTLAFPPLARCDRLVSEPWL